jgi:hypothetical protein
VEQGHQQGYDGRVLYRWYVYLPGKRVVTWAADKNEARRKAIEHRGIEPKRISPAPFPI